MVIQVLPFLGLESVPGGPLNSYGLGLMQLATSTTKPW